MLSRKVAISFLALITSVVLTFAAAPCAFAADVSSPSSNNLAVATLDDEQSQLLDISKANVSVKNISYSGYEVKPAFSVTMDGVALRYGIDYKIEYSNNVNAGLGRLTVTGIGKYTGTATGTFQIYKVYISNATVSAKTCVFNGKHKKPLPTVTLSSKTLKLGVDYTVSYSSNVSAGTGKVIVEGKGNYKGKAVGKFSITKASVSKFKINKSIAVRIYSGKLFKPRPNVVFEGKKLIPGKDFKYTYKANRAAGRAYVVVKGTGNFKGSKSIAFRIKPRSLRSATVQKIAKKYYTGSKIKPKPAVRVNGKKLKLGKDYTLSYRANVSVGVARVVIIGKGNYTGKKTVTFRIANRPTISNSNAAVGPAPEPVVYQDPEPSYDYGNSYTVYITNTGSKYHSSGCRYLRNSCSAVSLEYALSNGYSPCSVCNP